MPAVGKVTEAFWAVTSKLPTTSNCEESLALRMVMDLIPPARFLVSVILFASVIPLYFVIRVRTKQQKILSSFLFIALLTYGVHTLLESAEIIDYSIFIKICLIASAFGLIISYSFFQIRHNNVIIGGIFGLVMMISFGM